MIQLVICKNELFIGGAEKQLIKLGNKLPKDKYNVHIITHKSDSHHIAYNLTIKALKNKNYLSQIFELFTYLKKNNIDICHCWDFRSSIIGFFATLFLSTKLIDGSVRSAPSDIIFKKSLNFFLNKLKINLFAFLKIPIVSNSFAGLRAFNISNYKKSYVIYNCIETYSSVNSYQKKPDFKIGMLANMRFKKDFTTLINAAPLVLERHSNAIIYLMGDGPDKAKYENMVEKTGLKKNFVFTGFIKNTKDFISKMDICVLTNEYTGEGLSNSIMEYMASRKPVIATDLGGNNELVIHENNGFLIKEKDYIELASKINYLLDNGKKIKEFGDNGYDRITKFFSVEEMINKYEKLYTKVLAS